MPIQSDRKRPIRSSSSLFAGTLIVVVGPTWNREGEGKGVVGTCREPKCGGLLQAMPTHEDGTRAWYGAACLDCGHEVWAPAGRLLRRSSRRTEMPEGAWEYREQLLTRLKEG